MVFGALTATEDTDIRRHMSERSRELFRSLVQCYIEQGQPVGSRTLSRQSKIELSPATVRNIMADLEELGLIRAPHVSAGRVPTAKGYRLFVDSLLHISDLEADAVRRINEEITGEVDTQGQLVRASNLLSSITCLAGVVSVPRRGDLALAVRHLEFIALSEQRVLVVLVMNDNEVQNRIIRTPRAFLPAELEEASNYLNRLLAGRQLHLVRDDVLQEMKRMRRDINQLMQAAIELAGQVSDGRSAREDYVMAGETNLMDVAELHDVDKLKRLFDAFNRKRDILHLLDQAVKAEGVQIFIGEESGYEVLDDCSVVTSTYEVNGRVVGVLGVIGSMRMPYDKVIPIVRVTARMLGAALDMRH